MNGVSEVRVFSESSKHYLLMNKDNVLLEFHINEDLLNRLEIISTYSNLLEFSSEERFQFWLDSRVIPTNRNHIDEVLQSINVKEYSSFDILKINHACSLNDTFWIKEINEKNIWGDELKWKDVSLYRGFKESLGIISFFGNTSSLGGRLKTPELTTQGMLGKAWRWIDGTIKLYKKGTSGGCNTGNEPYSEVMASYLLDIVGIPHINYELKNWSIVLCSVCDLYTNESIGYLTMAEYLSNKYGSNLKWTYNLVLKEMQDLGLEKQFKDMLIFDYLILNKDRHFKNFGLLVDNDSRNILGFMPLFDHGYSLGNFALNEEDIKNDLNALGTFDVSLRVQGLTFSKEKRFHEMCKLIQLNKSKLYDLDIPKEKVNTAIKVLDLTTTR